jgi:hypothetical protein
MIQTLDRMLTEGSILLKIMRMKRTYFLITFIISAVFTLVFLPGAKGQTLSFSQVVLVGNTASTVPANKVWKVESYLGTGQLTGICIPTTTAGYWYKAGCLQGFAVNGNTFYFGTPCGSTNACYTNSACSGTAGSCSGFSGSTLPGPPSTPSGFRQEARSIH